MIGSVNVVDQHQIQTALGEKMNRKFVIQIALVVVGITQLFFGAAFTFAPQQFSTMLNLPEAPAWAYWMFGMFGARAFAFAYGMFLAARDSERHAHWIRAMIGVQAVDWLATMVYVLNGSLTLAQVSTASFLPLIFIGALVAFYPRQASSTEKARVL
jgi:4-hydroxybenzoate polyprenyltransferase